MDFQQTLLETLSQDGLVRNQAEKRIAELEYKNKHKIFTGSAPVSKMS